MSTLLPFNKVMEKLQLRYSSKNIPIPSKRSYRLQLMEKIELVIKRIKWKVFFYEQGNNKYISENYGLKSLNCPPKIKEMTNFEKDFTNLLKSIKFRATKSSFQQQLTEDIRTIKNTKTTLTFVDETSNVYKVPKEQHEKLLNNAITTSYKKVSKKTQDQINNQGKNILKNKEAIKRMFVNGEQKCFIKLKYHNPNFQNNPTVRLLNPAKNELGRISKTILDKVNANLRNSLHLNHWKNTQEVIDWFKGTDNKQRYKFIMFDIKDFYPSISRELLTDALSFAETIINLDDQDKKIIYHSRKSLLFNQEQTWMKKGSDLFDASMGVYDGAEVCELIGIFY